jgi:hypothetical protein
MFGAAAYLAKHRLVAGELEATWFDTLVSTQIKRLVVVILKAEIAPDDRVMPALDLR